MQMTHTTIRVILAKCPPPASIDALVLARVQMEGLYTICLLLEDESNIRRYLQDGWRKKYVGFLLQREECGDLDRFDDFSQNVGPIWLRALRDYAGVTDEQQWTVDFEELGTLLPSGASPQKIERFPTPGGIIDKFPAGDKRRMLERLHPEYQYLSSFAHGLAESSVLRTMFDKKFGKNSGFEKFRPPEEKMVETYSKVVVEPAFSISFLSIIQSAAELTALYPDDLDLKAAVTEAWEYPSGGYMLGKALWGIRTRRLLGAIT